MLVLILVQFIERFNDQNNKPSPEPTNTCKAPSSSKPGCCNINDTDSKSDEDCQQVVDATNSWMDEWKSYLNMHKVVPDNMGIVHWWGVRIALLFPYYHTELHV